MGPVADAIGYHPLTLRVINDVRASIGGPTFNHTQGGPRGCLPIDISSAPADEGEVKKRPEDEQELDFGFQPAPATPAPKGNDLLVVARQGAALSPAQAEFNKLMKRLENARTAQQRERSRLDVFVRTCGAELLPMVNKLHRLNFEIVVLGLEQMQTLKLTRRRREALDALYGEKAQDLVEDSCGLTEAEVEQMRRVVEEMGADQPEASDDEKAEAFDAIRDLMENVARQANIHMDLSDLDINDDPAEMERKFKERLAAAAADRDRRAESSARRGRKPTKAQLAKEKRRQEAEEAKRRDLKALYKQLAKVLHPDLESDPVRRQHKEEWMKRLTTAHSAADLREMLCIEMEWLGEESSNLATATDEKLKVYCSVLKEQIVEVKTQTENLHLAPAYAVLDRFRQPFTGTLLPSAYILSDLTREVFLHEEILEVLRAGGQPCQQMMNRWADEQAREMADERRIFG